MHRSKNNTSWGTYKCLEVAHIKGKWNSKKIINTVKKRLHGRETFEFSPWKRDQPQAYIERLKHCKHRERKQ